MAAVLWWPLAAWISPAAAWFVFFNAVVAAIALMSSGAQTPSAARRRLCRSGSSMVLDRLRSFSIFAAHPVAATAAPTGEEDTTAAASDSQFYRYGTREAEEAATAAAAQVAAPEQPARSPQAAAAAPADRTTTTTSSAAPPSAPVAPAPAEENDDEELKKAEPEAEEEQEDESISLDEAYALARRLRAQELASPPTPPPATAAETALTKKPVKKVAAAEGVTRRRTKAWEAPLEGKAELNARAELFIRQFREELKLQRLNSILSHTHALRSPTAAR